MTQSITATRRKLVKADRHLSWKDWLALKKAETAAIHAIQAYAELADLIIDIKSPRRKRGAK